MSWQMTMFLAAAVIAALIVGAAAITSLSAAPGEGKRSGLTPID